MKILILTDIHSDYNAAESVYCKEKPDFVLDCGDHEEIKNLFKLTPHFYIHGNHEPTEITSHKNRMPVPNKIPRGQIIKLEKDNLITRVVGLDGNYAPSYKPLSIDNYSIEKLSSIQKGEIDILLTHESPLLIPDNSEYSVLARKVISEIDRIEPKYVFSGHTGKYHELKTPKGITNIVLDCIARGYGILDGEKFKFKWKKLRFR